MAAANGFACHLALLLPVMVGVGAATVAAADTAGLKGEALT